MEIRLVRPGEDRRAVSRVYEESWRDAYRGIIPQAYLDGIPEGKWAAERPEWRTLVCTDGGRIVGVSSVCASRLAQYDSWGEIVSLYLLPAYVGKGHGRRLLEAAVGELNAMGFSDVFLWVLEENLRARRFYERSGFVRAGGVLEDCIGGKALRELRYVRRPSGGAADETAPHRRKRAPEADSLRGLCRVQPDVQCGQTRLRAHSASAAAITQSTARRWSAKSRCMAAPANSQTRLATGPVKGRKNPVSSRGRKRLV